MSLIESPRSLLRPGSGSEASNSAQLCQSCASISLKSLLARHRHAPSATTLLQSAKTCQLCSLMVQSIILWKGSRLSECHATDFDVEKTKDQFFSTLTRQNLDTDHTICMSLELTERSSVGVVHIRGRGRQARGDRDVDIVLGRLRLYANSKAAESPFGQPITRLPDLGHLSAAIEQWILDCRGHHEECNRVHTQNEHRSKARLPTRVLDISQLATTGEVRLWETKGSCDDYVALSHRWGGKTPVMTKTSNVKAHMNGFDFKSLPKTFQDACTVAFQLKMNYIWIDSLCIIQDDKEDWRKEASEMSRVYSNATLTIAATVAKDSEAGFLQPRIWSGSVRFPAQRTSNEAHEKKKQDPFYLDLGCYRGMKGDVDERELNRRAWVLQERVLSPRTVHFARTQVYWECWNCQEQEDAQQNRRLKPKGHNFPILLSPGGSTNDGSTPVETPKQWLQMVEKYTATDMTFQSDKLVAIGGLVDRIATRTKRTFYKGVWDDIFYESLLWIRATSDILETIPDQDTPTWSWASRRGAVGHVALIKDYALNTELTITQLGETVDNNLLYLQGHIYALDPRCNTNSESSRFRPPHLLKSQSAVSQVSLDGDNIGWVVMDSATNADLQNIFWIICIFDLQGPLSQQPDQEVPIENQHPLCILVKESGSGLDRYERVGIGLVYGIQWLNLRQRNITVI